MAKSTPIEYADSTVNPIAGCAGCELWNKIQGGTCYAAELHARFPNLGRFEEITKKPGRMMAAAAWPDLAGTPRLEKPWLSGRPRIIFCGDLAETAAAAIGYEYFAGEIIAAIDSPAGRRHDWLIFTKRPYHLGTWSKRLERWPANLLPVVSITNNEIAAGRIENAQRIEAPAYGLSAEPMLGPIHLAAILDRYAARLPAWLAIGGESGHLARPIHPAHVIDLATEARALGIAVFFKQWGAWRPAGPNERHPALAFVGMDGRLHPARGGFQQAAPMIKQTPKAYTVTGHPAPGAGRFLDPPPFPAERTTEPPAGHLF